MAHEPLRIHLAEDAMPTVTPRRLFPPAPLTLTKAEWQHCADYWAMRWMAHLADGNKDAARECKLAAMHCQEKAEGVR